MKPKDKNRVMCPDCWKQKLLFDSETKANNFIKWNKEDIQNGDELRAYYCPACCGWHISHQKFHKKMEGRTSRLIDAYLNDNNHSIRDQELIEELYKLLKESGLTKKRQINRFLSKPELTSKYNEYIKTEARIKYYREFNI